MMRGAAAGAAAAGVWALQEPIDKKVFGVDYSDADVLARALRAPRTVGMAMHIANGAIFGAVYARVAGRLDAPRPLKGAAAGVAEHLATWPLTRLLPRVNLWGNRRAFAQAMWRHVLFGAILGRLAEGYADGTPA